MTDPLARLIIGGIAALVVARLGYRRRALSASGTAAAVVVGATVVAAGGWWWGVLMVAFFATSSGLPSLTKRWHPTLGAGDEPKAVRGQRRDAVQVLANGGIPAALSLLAIGGDRPLLFLGYAGAIAAVTGDTWATEIGALSRAHPRLITTGKPVTPGTSGGITSIGTIAVVAGSVTIATIAVVSAPVTGAVLVVSPIMTVTSVTLAGLIGALTDSLAGATIQASYRCPRCNVPTEHRVHRCATATHLVHGFPLVTNDAVNLVCAMTGALTGLLLGGAL